MRAIYASPKYPLQPGANTTIPGKIHWGTTTHIILSLYHLIPLSLPPFPQSMLAPNEVMSHEEELERA